MSHLEFVKAELLDRKRKLVGLEDDYRVESRREFSDQADQSQRNEECARIQSQTTRHSDAIAKLERVKVYLERNPDFDECCISCGVELNRMRLQKFPEKIRCLDCEEL